MDSRAVVEEQPKGVGKQKNGQTEGKNRRVLRDIGNLVPARAAIEGKPQISRPITRAYCSKFLSNAQKEAEKNSKKPLAEVANGVVAGKDGVVAKKGDFKKDSDKLKPETLIVITDDKVKHKEENSKSERKLRSSGSSMKFGKTLTSILTARSKAACGHMIKPKDTEVDIDAIDINNELAVVEYVEEIYKFYKLTEEDGRAFDYMDSQPEINFKMRAILVDWLIEVHKKFELNPETLYLTINIMDRFLSVRAFTRKELQLVGISSMLIACKYEEIWAPEVNDFVAISDNAYIREQILVMEKAILGKLEWYLTVPTPYVFIVRYIKASFPSDPEIENMAFFFAELGLMHYSIMTISRPSELAASAIYAARHTLNKIPAWTETLEHYTGYSEDHIMDCAKIMVSFHSGIADNKLKAVYRKYSNPERGAVALFPPARNLLAFAIDNKAVESYSKQLSQLDQMVRTKEAGFGKFRP